MLEITKVTAEYGELRSTGYPKFENKKHAISYEAQIGPDDDFDQLRRLLHARAVADVKRLFGDDVEGPDLKPHSQTSSEMIDAARSLIASLSNSFVLSENVLNQIERLRKATDAFDQTPF